MRKSKTEHFTAKKAGWAINRYGMIGPGDKVLAGVSGGKDSLSLLRLLHVRKRWVPIDYTVKAIHVTTDYDSDPEGKRRVLEEYFRELGCDYMFRKIAIKEKNRLGRPDCFWCSWNRRKELFTAAGELGFNKVALGHNKDDMAETILMNMVYNGEISGINPVQELFGGKITIIRPLIFLEEKEVERYAEDAGLPVVASSCPLNDNSKRSEMKRIISELSSGAGNDIKKNIINAPRNIKKEYIGDAPGPGNIHPRKVLSGRSIFRFIFSRFKL